MYAFECAQHSTIGTTASDSRWKLPLSVQIGYEAHHAPCSKTPTAFADILLLCGTHRS